MPRLPFPYRQLAPGEPPRPLIPVYIQNPHTARGGAVLALVDSGADKCMFNTQLMAHLGITKSGPADTSIGGVNALAPVLVWSHDLCMGIVDEASSRTWSPDGVERLSGPVSVLFADGLPLNLLGRIGFLDNLTVVLDGRNQQVIFEF